MREVEFKSGDGEFVHGEFLEPSGSFPHPTIIFVHGFLSCGQEFGDYPERLCAKGYLVLAIDLRGHGRSEGQRGFISEDRAVADVQHALDFVDAQPAADNRRIALFGHSLGGAISICTAARDSRVAAVVAGAAVGRLRDELSPSERTLYRVVGAANRIQKAFTRKSIYLPYKVTYRDIFADPQSQAVAESKGFLQRFVPADDIPFVLRQDAVACARNVRVPALIVVGQHDRVVKQSNTRQVFDAIPGEKEWYVVTGSGHSFPTDGSREPAFVKISKWLDAHLMN